MDQSEQLQDSHPRKSIRFFRNDIKVQVITANFLGVKQEINCKLVDISSAGLQLSSKTKLGKKVKVTLILKFDSGRVFELNAKIVRHNATDHYLTVHRFPRENNFLDYRVLSLKKLHLFEEGKPIAAKYRNLNVTSVKILTEIPLNKKKQHRLTFELNDEHDQTINTEIVNAQHYVSNSYGFKFDKSNDALGDHLLETQTDLVFK